MIFLTLSIILAFICVILLFVILLSNPTCNTEGSTTTSPPLLGGPDVVKSCDEIVTETMDPIIKTFNDNWSTESKKLNLDPYTQPISIYKNPYDGSDRLHIWSFDTAIGHGVLNQNNGVNETCLILSPEVGFYLPVYMVGERSYITVGNIINISGLSSINIKKSAYNSGLQPYQVRFDLFLTEVSATMDKFSASTNCRFNSPGGTFLPNPTQVDNGAVYNIKLGLKPIEPTKPVASVIMTYNFTDRTKPFFSFGDIYFPNFKKNTDGSFVNQQDENMTQMKTSTRTWSKATGFMLVAEIINDVFINVRNLFYPSCKPENNNCPGLFRKVLDDQVEGMQTLIAKPILDVMNNTESLINKKIKDSIFSLCSYKYIIDPSKLTNCVSVLKTICPQLINNVISDIYNPKYNFDGQIKTVVSKNLSSEELCFEQLASDAICSVVRKRPAKCGGGAFTTTLTNILNVDSIKYSQIVDSDSDSLNFLAECVCTKPLIVNVIDTYIKVFCDCPSGFAGFACSNEPAFREWYAGWSLIKFSLTYDSTKPILNIPFELNNEGYVNVGEIKWYDDNSPKFKIIETTKAVKTSPYGVPEENNVTDDIDQISYLLEIIGLILKPQIISLMEQEATKIISSNLKSIVLDNTEISLLNKCIND